MSGEPRDDGQFQDHAATSGPSSFSEVGRTRSCFLDLWRLLLRRHRAARSRAVEKRAKLGEPWTALLVQGNGPMEAEVVADEAHQTGEIAVGAHAVAAEQADGDIAPTPAGQQVGDVLHPAGLVAACDDEHAFDPPSRPQPGADIRFLQNPSQMPVSLTGWKLNAVSLAKPIEGKEFWFAHLGKRCNEKASHQTIFSILLKNLRVSRGNLVRKIRPGQAIIRP